MILTEILKVKNIKPLKNPNNRSKLKHIARNEQVIQKEKQKIANYNVL